MLFKRKREMIRFSGRRHTKTGIASMIIGLVVIIGFLTISFISGFHKGQGGILLGAVGILLFGLSVLGFVLSYRAFKKKDIFYRYPILGAAINGFMFIVLLVLYIMGIGL